MSNPWENTIWFLEHFNEGWSICYVHEEVKREIPLSCNDYQFLDKELGLTIIRGHNYRLKLLTEYKGLSQELESPAWEDTAGDSEDSTENNTEGRIINKRTSNPI